VVALRIAGLRGWLMHVAVLLLCVVFVTLGIKGLIDTIRNN
jgi:hypothetical protein